MGFLSALGKFVRIGGDIAAAPFDGGATLADLPGAIGSAVSGASQAAGQNRLNQSQLDIERAQLNEKQQQDYFNAMQSREAARNQAAKDAFRQLQQASYLANWKAPTTSFSPYTKAIQGPSDQVRQAAADPALVNELLKRQNFGYDIYGGQLPAQSITFPDRSPSIWEKIGNFVGPGLSIYGAYQNSRDKNGSPKDDINV